MFLVEAEAPLPVPAPSLPVQNSYFVVEPFAIKLRSIHVCVCVCQGLSCHEGWYRGNRASTHSRRGHDRRRHPGPLMSTLRFSIPLIIFL